MTSFLVAAGCGGAISGPTPVSEDDFPLAVAHAMCDGLGGCCGSAGFAYDAAACVEGERKFAAIYKDYATNQGGGTWNATQAGNCVASIADKVAHCGTVGYTNPYEYDPACEIVYQGKKALGESCTWAGECAQSPDGDVTCAHGSTGVCQLRKHPSGGEACSSQDPQPSVVGLCDYEQSSAFVCSTEGTGVQGVCVAAAPVGGACSATNRCVDTAYCDGSKCVARGAAGAKCFDSNGCDDTTLCQNGTCAARLPNGAPCMSGYECVGGYCDGKCTSSDYVRETICNGTQEK